MEGFRWMRGARGLGAALVFLGIWGGAAGLSAQVQRGLAQSVLYCLASLVPSLFPFMVLASFGVRSGAGEVLGKLLGPVTRRLFRLAPGLRRHGAAKLPRGVTRQGPGASPCCWSRGKSPGSRPGGCLCFCVAPGAAFVVTLCGVGPVGQPAAGLAAFWGGDPLRAAAGPPHRAGQACAPGAPSLPAGGAGRRPHPLVWGDASSATVKMCGCILLFAGILAVLQGSGLFQRMAHTLAATVWLLPSQAAACSPSCWRSPGAWGRPPSWGRGRCSTPLAWAFGGLCVHMQVFAFFPEFPLAKGKFFLARLLHGLGAAGMYLLLERLFPWPSQPVWAAAGSALEYGLTASTGGGGGLSLLLMCLAFLVGAPAKGGEAPLPPGWGCAIMRSTKFGSAGRASACSPWARSVYNGMVLEKRKRSRCSAAASSPSCSYCQHNSGKQGEVVCALRQAPSPEGGACKKYQYDPLQREPRVAPSLRASQFRPEDFQL